MEQSEFFPKPIFVTGLPRSGTSMVAGAIQRCGVWTGETVAGGIGNPKGFYENIRLREGLVKPLLSQLGCDPLGVKSLPEFNKVPNVNGLLEGFYHFLAQDGYQGSLPWLYKDAKLTLLWPLVAQVFPNARWVVVRRDPEAIIHSCKTTHFMAHHSQSTEFWLDFVGQYHRRLANLIDSSSNVYEISADKLISGNSDEFKDLANTLNLTMNMTEIETFIAPELWKANTPQ